MSQWAISTGPAVLTTPPRLGLSSDDFIMCPWRDASMWITTGVATATMTSFTTSLITVLPAISTSTSSTTVSVTTSVTTSFTIFSTATSLITSTGTSFSTTFTTSTSLTSVPPQAMTADKTSKVIAPTNKRLRFIIYIS